MVKQKPPRRKPGFCKYGHEIAVVGVFSNRTCLGCRPQLASSQDEIKARHQAGESITALAREYDLDRRTIYKFVGKGEKRGGGEPRKVVFPVFMERAVGRLADKADVKLKLTNGRDALFEELLAVVKQHAGLAEKTDA
jgi:transposase-like protein